MLPSVSFAFADSGTLVVLEPLWIVYIALFVGNVSVIVGGLLPVPVSSSLMSSIQ